MRFILSVLLISIFVTLINAHARLVTPTPFSTNPSKSALCGSTAKQTVAQATFCPGKPTQVRWDVIVGDGTGDVTFRLSTNGGVTEADFAITLAKTGPTPAAVGQFFFDITIPTGTVCDNKQCVLQAFSNTNWFSCSVIDVSEDCATVPPPAAVRTLVKTNDNVKFCDQVVNKEVLLPAGINLAAYDASTNAIFKANMLNENVIGTNTTNCGNAYEKVLCDFSFPLSPGSDNKPVYQITREQCDQFVSECDVKSHVDLYPCDRYGDSSSSMITIPILFIAFILSFVLLF